MPDLYQTQALIDALRVKEELFKNPPEVPEQPAYPIEDYLLDDVVERAAGVAVDESRHKPSGDADPEPEPMGNAGPQAPQPDRLTPQLGLACAQQRPQDKLKLPDPPRNLPLAQLRVPQLVACLKGRVRISQWP